jgi:uncharacterized membrane protein
MQTRRWTNQGQPQTLQFAVFLLYINAAFGLFDMLSYRFFPPIPLAIVAAEVAAGYGIANEKKLGYYLGIAVAFMPFALRIYYHIGTADLLSLMFEIALVALLLHNQTREYTRIWFK